MVDRPLELDDDLDASLSPSTLGACAWVVVIATSLFPCGTAALFVVVCSVGVCKILTFFGATVDSATEAGGSLKAWNNAPPCMGDPTLPLTRLGVIKRGAAT